MKTIKINMLIAFVAIFNFAFANATDLPAQIKAFVTQNRTFINKIKTIPACSNLYNVFVTIERDADAGLSADDISNRFNQAFQRDNPSGEALKHYITAYGLLTKAFQTDKIPFVNPNPKKVETTDDEDYSDLYESNLDDDLAEAKAEFEKVMKEKSDNRAEIIANAKKIVKAGGNPADVKGWEEAVKRHKIQPEELL